MAQNTINPDDINKNLSWIRQGTTVLDGDNHKIGKVKYVQFSNGIEDPTFEMPDAFRRLPVEVQTRLLREGFVEIDAGLFSRDRFATPDQLAGLTDEGIRLRVPEDRLLKA
jgi:hypothetical protein